MSLRTMIEDASYAISNWSSASGGSARKLIFVAAAIAAIVWLALQLRQCAAEGDQLTEEEKQLLEKFRPGRDATLDPNAFPWWHQTP